MLYDQDKTYSVFFTKEEVDWFSSVSMDHNPLHIDEAYSRKSAYGQPVVFGVLGVLKCIRQYRKKRLFYKLDIEFRNPIFIDTEYSLSIIYESDKTIFKLLDNEIILIHIVAFSAKITLTDGNNKSHKYNQIELKTTPLDYKDNELIASKGVEGVYRIEDKILYSQKPEVLPDNISFNQLQILMACSYIVGMELPGKRAFFSKLLIEFTDILADKEIPSYQAKINNFNQPFRFLEFDTVFFIKEKKVANAKIGTFVRQNLNSISLYDIQLKLNSHTISLRGKVALLTGASRGLGAAFARVLAVCGVHVFINYFKSKSEAELIQQEIKKFGGNATLLEADISNNQQCQKVREIVLKKFQRLDILICNACEPPLSMRGHLSERYIEQNLELYKSPTKYFLDILNNHRGILIAISSIFIETKPKEFQHYIQLKRKVEKLIHISCEEFSNIAYSIVRPPKLLTDMNNTPMGAVDAIPPETIAIEVVNRIPRLISGKIDILNKFSESQYIIQNEKKINNNIFYTIAIVSSFSIEPILSSIKFWIEKISIPLKIEIAPYGQIFQELLNRESTFRNYKNNLNVIFFRLEDWVKDFKINSLDEFSISKGEECKKLVNDYIKALIEYNNSAACPILIIICPSSITTLKHHQWHEILSESEKKLYYSLNDLYNVKIIKAENWHSIYNVDNIFSPKTERYGHIPYQTEYYHILGTILVRQYFALTHKLYKAIVVDCDNTLWDGVCGEDASEDIQISDVFSKFQNFLIEQTKKGFIICLNSKNNESDVWNVFKNNNNMQLKKNHIVYAQINWDAKSANLKKLSELLSIGLDSMIFIDDNPVECAEVKANFPEVFTLQFLSDKKSVEKLLYHTWIFDCYHIGIEDKNRTRLYQENKQRKVLEKNSFNFFEFIQNLNLKISFKNISSIHLPRVSQLTYRTNQFNFTTKRRSIQEISKMVKNQAYECLTIDVCDRFGDYGLVGVIIYKCTKTVLKVDTLLLSCRVLGRGVEYKMLNKLGDIAAEYGLKQVSIQFIISAKNSPAKKFLEKIKKKVEINKNGEKIYNFHKDYLKNLYFDVRKINKKENQENLEWHNINYSDKSNIERKILDIASISYDMKSIDKAINKEHSSLKDNIEKNLTTSTRKYDNNDLKKIIINVFAKVLARRIDENDLNSNLENYGLDSYAIINIVVELSKTFENVHYTILFEHRTINNIIDYLTTNKEIVSETPNIPISNNDKYYLQFLQASKRANIDISNPEEIQNYIIELFNRELNLKGNPLDLEKDLELYSLDSKTITNITHQLCEQFTGLSSSILFEHRTVSSIVNFLLSEYTDYKPVVKEENIFNKSEMVVKEDENSDIAIIGVHGYYPKFCDTEAFWQYLKQGLDCIDEIPESRWDLKHFYHSLSDEVKNNYCQWGGFFDHVDQFDAAFFNISPREAEMMDPQQRLFLQVAWGVIEDAGYTCETIPRDTGVFVGVLSNDYNIYTSNAALQLNTDYRLADYYQIPNRVSYHLNLQGPSLAIDTACSSSGTAVHLACESLKNKTSSTAVVGGVNLILHPGRLIQYSNMQMLSKEPVLGAFSNETNGTLLGEGVGALLLKPLQQAINDKDPIYALIKATNINTSGKTNGFTVPDPNVHASLIEKAISKSNIDPRAISYVEAHGTGTPLGDPIEIRGLSMAFDRLTQSHDYQYCAIGSIKSNIGHLESNAAIAGITKVLLQMKYKMLAPSLHAINLNSKINFEKTPFHIQHELSEWKRPTLVQQGVKKEYPRIAGVSSFGAGGSNVHIILEEYISEPMQKNPVVDSAGEPLAMVVICLSAKTECSLREYACELLKCIQNNFSNKEELIRDFYPTENISCQLNLLNLAYTLQIGRQALDQRLGFLVKSVAELEEKLASFLHNQDFDSTMYQNKIGCYQDIGMEFDHHIDVGVAIDQYIHNRDYDKLLECWLNGLAVDWNKLYGDIKPYRINLPTYQFAKDRHWIPTTDIYSHKPVDDRQVSKNNFELMVFEECWEARSQLSTISSKTKNCVCFLSDVESQKSLVKTFMDFNPNINIIFVSRGDSYAKKSAQNYIVSSHHKNDYVSAFEEIKKSIGNVEVILYLWPIEDSNYIPDYTPIVNLLQASQFAQCRFKRCLLAAQLSHALDCCYVESWIGFERSLKLVINDAALITVFRESSEHEDTIKNWSKRLWQEMHAVDFKSVFYQKEKSFVCRIRQISLTAERVLLKNKGTYLITGGAGKLGLLFARKLANMQEINLVLVGRSPINNDIQDCCEKINSLGSKALYLQANVCDIDDLKRCREKVNQCFGKIRGVIHAAGIQHNQSIFEKDFFDFEKVLEPKIKGTLVINKVFNITEMDFICYFSSSSAILGDFGSCDYAIANRFQMAYTDYQHQSGCLGKAIVINWPQWKDGAMGFGEGGNTKMALKSSGQRLLESTEGFDMFMNFLGQKKYQHLLLAGKPDRVYDFLGITSPLVNSSNNTIQTSIKEVNIKQLIEEDLQNYINQLLKIPKNQLDIKRNLADFGFDSIRLKEFAHFLTQHFTIEVTPLLFFEYPTLEKISTYFTEQYAEIVENIYRQEGSEDTMLDKKSSRVLAAPITHTVTTAHEPIAIIGMSGRFPEARNIHEMWNILSEQRHVVQEISIERFPEYQEYLTQVNGGHWWSGCIPGAYEFDPLFFEISPLEAEMMDPRQRLLLQESWNALEDAGYGQEDMSNKSIGMFVGAETGDYQGLASGSNITSKHNAMLAARLAYFLNLSGPVMSIDTTCSSALVALHQACVNLRQHECDTAIVAGVNLCFALETYQTLSHAGMLSPDGKCFTFDKRANGMVPGEAVVAVVLKPLSQAIADGDPVYASIRGSGLNYDGKTNGITAPSGTAQTALLKQVYEQAQVDVKHIDYIVAHGTGTQLGDPIEVNALYDAFKDNTDKQNYCALTSTKTNFGHTFAASGLVSLVSLVQALEHEQIPASLHCEEENDYIHWSSSPFYVNKQTRPWPKQGNKARMGALSAFGISGTNTHVIVEDSIREAEGGADPLPYYLIVLSAKTESALQARIHRLQDALQEDRLAKVDMSALAYTLQTGRHHFQYRSALVVQDREDAIYSLGQLRDKVQRLNGLTGHAPRGFKGQIVMVRYIDLLLDKSSTVQEVASDYQEVLLGLADYYCQGYEIDWWRLYEGRHPPRLHLPTYPFAREEYRPTPRVEKPGVTASIPLSSEAVSETSVTPDAEIVLSYPHWQPQTLAGAKEGAIACDRWVLWYGLDIADEWLAEIKGVEFIRLSSASSGVEKRYGDIALAVFEWLKHLLQESPNSQILIQVLIPNEEEYRVYAGISGLLKTAHLENPAVKGQVIEVEPGLHRQALQAMIEENAMTPDIRRIRYESGDRWVQQWAVEGHEPCGQEVLWQPGGVYLISGGVGGIGLHIAHAMAVDVSDVVFILTGRSRLKDLTVAQREKLTELASLCARLEYHSVDVGSRDELKHLLDTIVTSYGQLDGIVHSAGITRDNFILKKSVEEFDSVLHPKVSGAVYLDELTRDMDIDFFILFSSISSVLGNVGQSDYAVANSFMDEFALYRHRLVERQARRGRTVSINWPYWKEGGMRLEASTEALMQQNDVMVALETQQGVEALRRALQTGHGQLMVTMGEPVWMKEPRRPTLPESTAVEMDSRPLSELDDKCLRQKVQRQFKGLLAEVIKLPLERMDTQAPLERYGIDSLIVIQVNQALAAIFDALPKTLLFEYQTIDAVVAYLVEQHRQACRVWTGLTATGQAQREGVISSTSSAGVEPVTPRQKEGHPIQKDIKCREHPVTDEPIAIIGLSGHYPQANSLDAYWENLKAGKDCIREIPDDRWSLDGFFHEDVEEAIAQGKSYSKWGGFLEGFADFDPLFFNLSPREVMTIDPQERLFLQSAWEAVEDAGYTRAQLASQFNKRVGVFAGITKTGFDFYGIQSDQLFSAYTSFSSVANRVSYFLGLQGPSLSIDTMCSSSLTAIHEACEHLHRQRCELAIAGGVNLYLHPSTYIRLCTLRMLSKEGLCKSFGYGGNGFVPGEGVGAVLLKPLSRAIQDQDSIYAIIRGSCVNHGGKTNGYTVPNPHSQGDLIREALDKAQVNARMVSYIEAHGTGTELGDPIEVRGLTQAFQQDTDDVGFCVLGSVKSNIGHLEAAAGIAGLSKVILQMKYEKIVASLHAERLNANINFEQTPFVVQQSLNEWERPNLHVNGKIKEYPRTAGISSFGAGGTNAHIIIQEYIPEVSQTRQSEVRNKPAHPVAILLSAHTSAQLLKMAEALLLFIRTIVNNMDSSYSAGDEMTHLVNVAYTLQVGREAMQERLGFVVNSLSDIEVKLQKFIDKENDIEDFYRDQIKTKKEISALFNSDEDLQEVIKQWMRQKKLSRLLSLWVKGVHCDWNFLYQHMRTKPYRLHLPTYPFAYNRYWIDDNNKNQSTVVEKTNTIIKERKEQVRLEPLDFMERKKLNVHEKKPFHCSLSTQSEAWSGANTQTSSGKQRRSYVQVLKQDDILRDLKSALPTAVEGMIPTLNRTGVMTESLSSYSEAFANYAGMCGGEVLDLGCAYGIATIAALERGAQVLAVDMEAQHLEILSDRIRDEVKSRLSTQVGKLLDLHFDQERFAAIHASRVLHFLNPQDFQQALQKMYGWLKPGGKLFIVTDTPYMGYWASKAGVYETRKAAGDLWPGYIDNVGSHFNTKEIEGAPTLINPMDPEILHRECKKFGFHVEETVFFAGEAFALNNSLEKSGREHVGIIALKPELEDSDRLEKSLLPVRKTETENKEISLLQIQTMLRESLEFELDIEPGMLDELKPFTDLGLDSINGVTWIRKINSHYGLSMTATKVYDYPNIIELAEFLRKQIISNDEKQHQPSISTIFPTSLDELLKKIQEGTLGIEEADQLIDELPDYHLDMELHELL
uniref:BryA n=1 Tax=Candidatus Endobugula sertula TaxID=62101 RepID=A2CLL5_9GAMM|nr:BryA [Candidatus Endobugula sertula]